MARWEYRQEAFCTQGGNPDQQPPWWEPQRNGTEVDWLNRLGAEGWELIAIEEKYHLYGHIGTYPAMGGGPPVAWEGAIPAKRWTFRREVAP